MDRTAYYKRSKSLIRKLHVKGIEKQLSIRFPRGTIEQWKQEHARLKSLLKKSRKNKLKKGGARKFKKITSKQLGLPSKLVRGRKIDEAKERKLKRSENLARLRASERKALERAERRIQTEEELHAIASKTYIYKITGAMMNRRIVTKHIDKMQIRDFANPLLVSEKIKESGIRNNVRVLYYLNDKLRRQRTYPTTTGRKYKDKVLYDWLEGESPQSVIFDIDYGFGDQILIIQPESNIPAQQIAQRFLDGSRHCAFSAPLEWAKEMIKTAKASRTINRYSRIMIVAARYIKQYPLGATIEEITKFCNTVKISYKINDAFNKLVHDITVPNSRKTMTFINSRINHLDTWSLNTGRKVIEQTQDEINALYTKLRDNNDRPHYGIDKKGNKLWIATPAQKYRVKSPFRDIYNKFYDEYSSNQLDAVMNLSQDVPDSLKTAIKQSRDIRNSCIWADEDINNIVLSGLHQTGSHNYPIFLEHTIENSTRLDQKTAYASFKTCEYYAKFPFLFNEYAWVDCPLEHNKKWLQSHLGIYFVVDIDYSTIPDENFRRHMLEIKPYTSGYTDGISLPSPELIFMIDKGIKFTILCGTWTHHPFDFEFPEFMMSKIDGIRHFQRLIGEWSAFRPDEIICLDGSEDWCADLKAKGYNAIHYSDPKQPDKEGTIQVTFTKDMNRISHKAHLAAFCCSYQRIQLFQQLAEVPFDDTYAVITDEIVLKKEHLKDIKIREGFREKNSNKKIPFSCARSLLSLTRQSFEFPAEDFKQVWGELEDGGFRSYIGQGGSGKTHSFMINGKLLRKIYTAPSQQLRQDKQSEFPNVNTDVHCNMITYPGISRNIHSRTPANILHDEVTCSSQEQINKLRLLYPYSTIILAGDLDHAGLIYQLPCVEGTPVSIENSNITEFTQNYRAKDNELKSLLTNYRKMMQRNYKYDQTTYINTISYINTKKIASLKKLYGVMSDEHKKCVDALIKKRTNITNSVSYIQNVYVRKKGFDRTVAQGISIQAMPKAIRNYVSGEFYYDVDIVNSGPTILYELCRYFSRKYPDLAEKFDTRCLNILVEEREKLFTDIINNCGRDFLDRDILKEYFISALNGGHPNHLGHIDNFKYGSINRFGAEFQKEIKCLTHNFKIVLPDIAKIADDNNKCFISSIIFHFEDKILSAMIEFFRLKRHIMENSPWVFTLNPLHETILDCIPFHDGVMIPKHNGKITDQILNDCLKYISTKVPFHYLKLKIKEPESEYKMDVDDATVTEECKIHQLDLNVWRPNHWKKEMYKEMFDAVKKIQRITPEKLEQEYSNDDFILTGKHKAIDKWTNMLNTDKSGNKRLKFLVRTNNTKIKDGNGNNIEVNNGTIIKDDSNIMVRKKKHPTEKLSIEERHAFTCHQIQGSTIKGAKIYIDIENMFDKVRMLYVAISRAEYIDQLRIIRKKKPSIIKSDKEPLKNNVEDDEDSDDGYETVWDSDDDE